MKVLQKKSITKLVNASPYGIMAGPFVPWDGVFPGLVSLAAGPVEAAVGQGRAAAATNDGIY